MRLLGWCQESQATVQESLQLAKQSLLAKLGEAGHHEETFLLQHFVGLRRGISSEHPGRSRRLSLQRRGMRECKEEICHSWPHPEGGQGFCPAGCGLSKDTRRHHRWQVTERCAGRNFSKTLAMCESKTDDSALAFCLRKAWQMHVSETGTADFLARHWCLDPVELKQADSNENQG